MKDIYNYIPESSHQKIREYLDAKDLSVLIKNKRATKHGDFRKTKNGNYLITVNNNLNPSQFLLTLVHEIAHYKTHKLYGKVKPHGIEWKTTFKELMLPFVRPEVYPNKILPILAKYLLNAKASTDSDQHLSLALKQEPISSDKNYIFELKIGYTFEFKNRKFKLLEKRRTRSLCLDLGTKKKYLIHLNSEVRPLH
ncbi:SprT-like domain-containing protein [Flavicella sp.]|uniref:SprT-like domain-containing protein n=1 Tax=Flavicella sp. TaxID=2957742 RepID=UPI003018F9FC